MSKIVFINPSIDKYSKQLLWSSHLTNTLFGRSMTLMSKLAPMVMAALTPPKHSFVYIDEEIEDINYDKIDADLIAIGSMTAQANRAYEIADEFRRRGVSVILGGIHASVCPEDVAEHADSILIGEGENTWPRMVEDFERGELKAVYDAKDYPPVEMIVSPKPGILKHEHYMMYTIQATKGCPYDCEFCSIKFSSGHKYRMKPVSQVVAEIKDYERYNKGLVKRSYFFVDDNLYVNREYTKELFIALKDLKITWQGQGTLNTANDDEILKLMAESGCRGFKLGFESISEESLKEANKRSNSVAEYEKAINKLIKYGIAPAGFFIFGFDSDDVNIFERTRDYAVETLVFFPYFSILTPYPGTRLCDRMERDNRVTTKDWALYNSLNCVFTPKKMTAEELQAGTYWTFAQLADLELFKRQFSAFWAKGPWLTNPRLTFSQRIILRLWGLALRKEKVCMDFLFWAARQKNAADMESIMTAVSQYELSKQHKDFYNPAERRAIEEGRRSNVS